MKGHTLQSILQLLHLVISQSSSNNNNNCGALDTSGSGPPGGSADGLAVLAGAAVPSPAPAPSHLSSFSASAALQAGKKNCQKENHHWQQYHAWCSPLITPHAE